MGMRLVVRTSIGKIVIAAALALALFMSGATQPTHAATQKGPAFALTFTCASAVDSSFGVICVHTNAGTALSITVRYCTGYLAVSRSLKGSIYANSSGNASWWWKPQTKCRGRATATVRAIWHGLTYWRTDTFIVR